VAIFAPSDVWTRLGNLKSAASGGNLKEADDRNSAAQRLEIWRVAWEVHKAFPIVGVGWAGYPIAHSDYARRTGFEKYARGARDAHSTYLTLLGETGWIGMSIWLSMIASVVLGAIRAMRRVLPVRPDYALQIKVLLLALLSYGMAGVFGSFGAMSFTYIQLATIIAATIVTNRELDNMGRTGRLRRSAA
jgi:O-antigen ligase